MGIGLHGRTAELSRISQALTSARSGASSVLVVTGPAGIGKSALLAAAVDLVPDDTLVLRADGTEAEWHVAGGGLSALLRPVLPLVDGLGAPTRAALSSAMALSGADGVGAPALGMAVLDVLAAAAERSPVLVVLDDVPWLDPSSRRSLAFAVRRLRAERVCVLLSARPPLDAVDLDRLPTLELPALDESAVRTLVRELAPVASLDAVSAVVATAAGVPRTAVELVRSLRPEQRDGRAPVPDPLPAPPAADEAARAELAAVPVEVRNALGVAAAEPSGELGPVATALAALGVPTGALDDAERRGLVEQRAGRVLFRHPFLRSAAYHLLDAPARRRVHRALADALPAGDVDRRAWHLGASTPDLDDDVAVVLAEAGHRARRRGAPEEAARAFERSALLAHSSALRAASLLSGAEQALVAGDVERARRLAADAERCSPDADLRSAAVLVLARATALQGDPTTAFHRLRAEVQSAGTVSAASAAASCLEAFALALQVVPAEADALAERALQLAEQAQDPGLLARARLACELARALQGRPEAAAELPDRVDEVLAAGVPLVDLASLLTHITLTLHAGGHSERAMLTLNAVARTARATQALGVLPQVLLARAEVETLLNRYADAWGTTSEAALLAEHLGQRRGRRDLAFRLAGLSALQGRTDEARELYAEVLAHGSHDFLWLRGQRGLGLLELSLGRPEAAITHLEQIDAAVRALGGRDLSMGLYEHDLALAYVEAGRYDDARQLTERFAALAAGSPLASVASALTYMRAALAPDEELDEAFGAALEAARPQPLSLVRVHATYAQRLAAVGRDAECADHLRAARQTAEAISTPAGALWVDRVAAGLRSAPPGPVPAPLDGLEHSVATAVVNGHSVAQAGRDVLVSEATAGHLLQRALRTTGATSLDALARRLSDPPGPDRSASTSASTSVVVLGRFGVVRDGALLPGPPGVPGRALRILAVRGRLHVEELSELLWPGADAQAGRPRLRNVVSRIRSAVGPVVERTEDLIGLAPDVEVDTERFEQLAKQALAVAAQDPIAATEPAAAAVELYAGPLLPDCPYDEWAVAPRERARRRYVGLLDVLAESAALRGETDAALALLERAAESEPYDDERLLRAAELCLDAGRRGAAAALLERAGSLNGRLGVPTTERFQQLSVRLSG